MITLKRKDGNHMIKRGRVRSESRGRYQKPVPMILFLLFSFMHLNSYAYEIKADTVIVEYNDFQAEQIIVSINNNEEDTLWIWFDDKNVEDEGLYIKKYLMKGHCPECSSFFHIATSANIDNCWWKPSTSIRLL